MKTLTRLTIGLLLTALICCACQRGAQAPAQTATIRPYAKVVILTAEQKSFLLRAAREGLAGRPLPAPDALLKAVGGAGASVEVFFPPQEPVIVVVGGDNFYEAFSTAVAQAAADKHFQRDIRPQLAQARIKVGVIDRIAPLPFDSRAPESVEYNRLSQLLEDGVHGLILDRAGRATFLHPDLTNYRGWGLKVDEPGEREKRVRGRHLLRRQLGELSAMSGEKWQTGKLFAFSGQSFIDAQGDPGKPLDCYRAKIIPPPLDEPALRAAAWADIEYLLRIVHDDGKLDYVYYPVEDAYDPDYDMPRHIGHALRLLQAHEVFPDEHLLAAARKSLAYTLERLKIPTEAPHVALISDENRSLLGSNALMAMFYASMPAASLTEREIELRDRFGEAILFFRMNKPGYFYTTFREATLQLPPEKQALYFPGIALLALVRLYEQTGREAWWDAAVEIAAGHKRLWQADGHRAVGNYCWTGQAWARMARLAKDPAQREEYRRLAYSHADAVVRHQWTPDRPGYFPDYPGAADNSRPPRTTPTSSRAESLVECYLTAKHLGDVEAQKRYGVALLQALHFMVQNQYTDDNSWYLPYPAKAKGGIRGGLTAGDIRIDYCQHALFSLLNALNVPDELRALGVSEW
ncbi:MAG TPA: hypothetical protein PKW95_03200 [bacterium]|nr:hypothetical protein [bacterium]